MRVILLQDVNGMGKKGDVLEVKDGYARNYLLPKKIAQQATKGLEAEMAHKKQRESERVAKEKAQMEALARTLKDTVVTIPAKSGEDGRLFGAVTNSDVAKALNQMGYSLDKKKISMHALKHLGDFSAELHLFAGISTEIAVRVVPE